MAKITFVIDIQKLLPLLFCFPMRRLPADYNNVSEMSYSILRNPSGSAQQTLSLASGPASVPVKTTRFPLKERMPLLELARGCCRCNPTSISRESAKRLRRSPNATLDHGLSLRAAGHFLDKIRGHFDLLLPPVPGSNNTGSGYRPFAYPGKRFVNPHDAGFLFQQIPEIGFPMPCLGFAGYLECALRWQSLAARDVERFVNRAETTCSQMSAHPLLTAAENICAPATQPATAEKGRGAAGCEGIRRRASECRGIFDGLRSTATRNTIARVRRRSAEITQQ